MKIVFNSWCDSCAGLSRMWLIFRITVTNVETHHPLSRCAHIHCLVCINIQQTSMNVNGCHFFSAWRNSVTHLRFILTLPCQTQLCQSASLLPYIAQQQTAADLWEGLTSTDIQPSTSDIMSQHNKIGGITFGLALV